METQEVSAADKAAKADAHTKITKLNTLFEMYNNKELENDTDFKTILKLQVAIPFAILIA